MARGYVYPTVGCSGRGQPDEHLDAECPSLPGVVGLGFGSGVDGRGSEISGRAVEKGCRERDRVWRSGSLHVLDCCVEIWSTFGDDEEVDLEGGRSLLLSFR